MARHCTPHTLVSLNGLTENQTSQKFNTQKPSILYDVAHPINIEKDFERLDPNNYQAEWKWMELGCRLFLMTLINGFFHGLAMIYPELFQILSPN